MQRENTCRTSLDAISRALQHCTLSHIPYRVVCQLIAYPSVTQKTGVKSSIKPPPPPPTTILDVHNFDEVALVRE